MQTFIPCKLICTKITDCILPSSAQAQAPDWLSSIIIAEGNLTGHPEKYNFHARAMLWVVPQELIRAMCWPLTSLPNHPPQVEKNIMLSLYRFFERQAFA